MYSVVVFYRILVRMISKLTDVINTHQKQVLKTNKHGNRKWRHIQSGATAKLKGTLADLNLAKSAQTSLGDLTDGVSKVRVF